MAWYDEQWQDNGEYYEIEQAVPLNDILFGNALDVDLQAQALFMEAFFQGDDDVAGPDNIHIKDTQAYADLIDYMWDVYGIDFEDAFSWEDFREWYG